MEIKEIQRIMEKNDRRKGVRFWRGLFFGALIVTPLIYFGLSGYGQQGTLLQSSPIVRVHVDEMIIDEAEFAKEIEMLAANDAVKAVIIYVNSPGGTTNDSEILYDSFRKIAEKKPVVTQMDSMATSGGYLVSLAGEKIFARTNTITGSIGVIMQSPDFSEAMNKIGVKYNLIRTSEHKGEPLPFKPLSDEARADLQAVINESHQWFTSLVAERRKLKGEALDAVTDGRIFLGGSAKKLGLLDEIGSEREIRAYLKAKYKLDEKAEITEQYRPQPEKLTMLDYVSESVFGVNLKNASAFGMKSVDGLLSIWQPSNR